jgi:hypothetical protein
LQLCEQDLQLAAVLHFATLTPSSSSIRSYVRLNFRLIFTCPIIPERSVVTAFRLCMR